MVPKKLTLLSKAFKSNCQDFTTFSVVLLDEPSQLMFELQCILLYKTRPWPLFEYLDLIEKSDCYFIRNS